MTRTTAILAACFFATSIALALLASAQRAPHSVIDSGPLPTSSVPALPALPSHAPPATGQGAPAAPLAK